MEEKDIISRLIQALVKCGIQRDAMFRDMRVSIGDHQCFNVDFLVASEDRNIPLYLFEVKANGFRSKEILRNATMELKNGLAILPCFVAVGEGGSVYISRIKKNGCTVWVDISDEDSFCRLIGDYQFESEKVINLCGSRSSELHRQELKQFRYGLTGSGAVVLLVLFIFEAAFGKAISYQFVGLVGLVFVLYAASYGIIRELKFKSLEISFCSQENV